MTEPSRGEGLFSSLKRLMATLVAMSRTRLELLGSEIAIEKQRALRLLVLSQALMFCLGLFVMLLLGVLLMLFWDQRLIVASLLLLLLFGLSAYFYVALMRALNPPEALFSASLAELEEDLRQLKAASTHVQKAE